MNPAPLDLWRLFFLGYLLPFALLAVTLLVGRPVNWGWSGWPCVIIGAAALHQLVFAAVFLRCAIRRRTVSARVVSGLLAPVCLMGAVALGFLTFVTWKMNHDSLVLDENGSEYIPDIGNTTLAGWRPGKTVAGPALSSEDYRGKIVLVEYWGVDCGPCLSALPHLSELRKRYGAGLVIIANQTWSSTDERTVKVFRKYVREPEGISVVNHGAIEGVVVRSFPTVLIYDRTGRFLWRGHPGAATEAALQKAFAAGSR